jgi:hypothetical protein
MAYECMRLDAKRIYRQPNVTGYIPIRKQKLNIPEKFKACAEAETRT